MTEEITVPKSHVQMSKVDHIAACHHLATINAAVDRLGSERGTHALGRHKVPEQLLPGIPGHRLVSRVLRQVVLSFGPAGRAAYPSGAQQRPAMMLLVLEGALVRSGKLYLLMRSAVNLIQGYSWT